MRTPCFTTAVVEPLYITTLGQPSISNRTVARAHTLTRVASSRHKQTQIKIRGKTLINIIIVRKRGGKGGSKAMHSWTQRLLAAATTAGVLLAAACAAASALDAFHAPTVQAQAHVSISSSPRLFNYSELGAIRD